MRTSKDRRRQARKGEDGLRQAKSGKDGRGRVRCLSPNVKSTGFRGPAKRGWAKVRKNAYLLMLREQALEAGLNEIRQRSCKMPIS